MKSLTTVIVVRASGSAVVIAESLLHGRPEYAPVTGVGTEGRSRMRWTADPVTEHGVLDRGFMLGLGDHVAPGVLLTLEEPAGALPLVLVGHGRTLHKRHPAPYAVARRRARCDQLAVALLDQPAHGARPAAEEERSHEERSALAVQDWTAALDALADLSDVDGGLVGYWGLSLGTNYGLPFVAADARIGLVVLGLYGPTSKSEGDTGAASIAATLNTEVLWVMQWDDELFDRAGQLALFDAIGSADKRLLTSPGGHNETPDEGLRFAREFLTRGLGR
jgi:dienelactone hydrolase